MTPPCSTVVISGGFSNRVASRAVGDLHDEQHYLWGNQMKASLIVPQEIRRLRSAKDPRRIAWMAQTRGSVSLRWPWWCHPFVVVLLMPGSLALLAIFAGPANYQAWEVSKYIDPPQALLLVLGIVALLAGAVLGSVRALLSIEIQIIFSNQDTLYIVRVYKFLLTLTVLGYIAWAVSAAVQGVGVSDLLEVVTLQPGAISGLKDRAAPIGGVTTLTQLGPVVVILGMLMRDMDVRARGMYVVIGFAAFRALFYAERLAVIEVLIPLAVYVAAKAAANHKLSRLANAAPLLAAPAVWAIFAALEYTRSWIYYQNYTTLPYVEWVTTRLFGYYVTSYNNSALVNTFLPDTATVPFYTFRVLWEAPVVGSLLPEATVNGQGMSAWWQGILYGWGNPNFNNQGSFLVTNAELGTFGMVVFWLLIGIGIGAVYASAKRGSVPGLIAYTCIFVGLLELPRFIYWTQGRAFPALVAVAIIALSYPRVAATKEKRTHKAEASQLIF
jgi:hypothetical protein